MSPALAGGFLTTAPPGKPGQCVLILCFCCQARVWVFALVFLNLFKTPLKVELLSLEGTKRVPLEGLEEQEEILSGCWPRRWQEHDTK